MPTVVYPVGFNMVGAPSGTSMGKYLYRYNAQGGSYDRSVVTTAGQGGWAYFVVETSITFEGLPDYQFPIDLEAGWNMVANPFNVDINVPTGYTARIYTPVAGTYSITTTIPVGHSVWIKVQTAGTIQLTNPLAAPPQPEPPPELPPVNQPPVASFTATVNALTVNVNASSSSDSDGTIASYGWDFGDGTTGTGVTASHTYPSQTATYNLTLTVTDDDGDTTSTSKTINVTAGTGATITGNSESGTIVNVDTSGAIGDGVNNDTAEIQSAINALAANATLVGTAGKTYSVTELFLKSNMTLADIKFQVRGSSTNGELRSAVNIGNRATPTLYQNITLRNVEVDGNRGAFTNIMNGSDNEDGGKHGIKIQGAVENILIENCNSHDCATDGIHIQYREDSTPVGYPAGVVQAKRILIMSSNFNKNRRHGMFIQGIQVGRIVSCTTNQNGVDIGTTEGLLGARSNNTLFGAGLIFRTDTLITSTYLGGYNDVLVDGHAADNNARAGILFYEFHSPNIGGYTMLDNITVRISTVSDGSANNAGSAAIHFNATSPVGGFYNFSNVTVGNNTTDGSIALISVNTGSVSNNTLTYPVSVTSSTGVTESNNTVSGGTTPTPEPDPIGGNPTDYVNVKSYGAVGNNSTDDRGAIQRALNSGKNVYLPTATYRITGELNVPSGIVVFGDGQGKSIIRTTNYDQRVLSIGGSSNTKIRHLECRSGTIGDEQTERQTIYVSNGRNNVFEYVTARNNDDSGFRISHSGGTSFSYNNTIRYCRVYNTPQGAGIELIKSGNNKIHDNYVTGSSQYGIRINGQNDSEVWNNEFVSNQHGINYQGYTGSGGDKACIRTRAHHNRSVNSGRYNVFIFNDVRSCIIDYNRLGWTGGSSSRTCFQSGGQGSNPSGNTARNNQFFNCQMWGLTTGLSRSNNTYTSTEPGTAWKQ